MGSQIGYLVCIILCLNPVTSKWVERAIVGTCPTAFFQCASTGSCIEIAWQCDGENDCTDGSDEANCGGSRPTYPTTTTTPFMPVTDPTTIAATNHPINAGSSGSPLVSAPGMTGSPHVSVPSSIECGKDYFYCSLDSACIPLEWLCDGDLDCNDGSDEKQKCTGSSAQNTQNTTIPDVTTPRSIGSLSVAMTSSQVPQSLSSNPSQTSAAPQAATTNVPQPSRQPTSRPIVTQLPNSQCPLGYFVCDTGSCQPLQWACDGESDCDDGSDEKYCNGVTKSQQLPQRTNAPVVPVTMMPGSQIASSIGSVTDRPATFVPFVKSTSSIVTKPPNGISSSECGSGYFYCLKDSLCIPTAWLCDADIDCSDGDDEKQSCPSAPPVSSMQTTQMAKSTATAGLVSTVAPILSSSTTQSPRITNQQSASTQQPSGTTQQQTATVKNTAPPSSNCPANFFSCASTSSCVSNNWYCDGEPDCADGSDEKNCARSSPVTPINSQNTSVSLNSVSATTAVT